MGYARNAVSQLFIADNTSLLCSYQLAEFMTHRRGKRGWKSMRISSPEVPGHSKVISFSNIACV